MLNAFQVSYKTFPLSALKECTDILINDKYESNNIYDRKMYDFLGMM
jgi:hypothetical protein